jgi:Flp pilus assembly protein TadG
MARVAAALSRVRRSALPTDRRATIAIIFALAAIPLLGLVGLAVDFGFATQAKSQLSLAADAAAMQATVTAANAYNTGGADLAQAEDLGQTAGLSWFTVQSGSLIDSASPPPAPSIAITYNAGVFTTTLTYQVSVSTYFGRMFGVSSIAESGTSQAVISLGTFIDVSFLLDNSSSMTIASTQAGINKLNALTNAYSGQYPPALVGSPPTPPSPYFPPLQPCAFACHWTSTTGTTKDGLFGRSDDFYGIAKKHHIQLRFDVLKNATATSIGTMQGREIVPNQFGIGVFTFNSALTQIYPTTVGQVTSTDLADALPAVEAMDTPVTNDAANTNFTGPDGAMAQLTALLPASGDGSTAAAAQQAMIIVTDGMEDWGSREIPAAEGPITPDNCAAAKAKGITVYVLYTTYDADSSVLLYTNSALAPYLAGTESPGMVASLQACASQPSDFIQATNAAAITAAFNTLLLTALASAGRFTE